MKIESFTHNGYRLHLIFFRERYYLEAENLNIKGRRVRKRWSLGTDDRAKALDGFYTEKLNLQKMGRLDVIFESGLSPLIDRFLEWSRINTRSRGTYVSHKGTIEKFRLFVRRQRKDRLSPALYEKYKEHLLDQGLSTRTVDIHLTTIKKMLTVLESLEVIPKGIFPRPKLILAKRSTVPKFWTAEDVDRIIRAAEGTYLQEMLIFSLNTGLRLNELRHLRWDDANLEAGFIVVQGYEIRYNNEKFSFEPKDHQIRRIKLNREAKAVLNRRRKDTYSDTPFVFASKFGAPRYNNLGRDLREILEKAGVTDKGLWHSARRTWGSHLLMKGADVKSVQSLYGHSRLDTTQAYLNVTDKHLDDTVDLVEFKRPSDCRKRVMARK